MDKTACDRAQPDWETLRRLGMPLVEHIRERMNPHARIEASGEGLKVWSADAFLPADGAAT